MPNRIPLVNITGTIRQQTDVADVLAVAGDIDTQTARPLVLGTVTATSVILGLLGSVALPNVYFTKEVNHILGVVATTTVETAGASLQILGARGGATAGAAAGGAGGALYLDGESGGAGSAIQAAGAGGTIAITTGDGGPAAGGVGGAAGTLSINTGVSTLAVPTGGLILIGDQRASAIRLGNAVDNTLIQQMGTGAVTFGGYVSIAATGYLELAERANPGGGANVGRIYTSDVAGVTELFYTDSASVTSQLTGAAGTAAQELVIACTIGGGVGAGDACYMTAVANTVGQANAAAPGTARVVGWYESVANRITKEGIVEAANKIVGTAILAGNTLYLASGASAGKVTPTAPAVGISYVVGVAMAAAADVDATVKMLINREVPIDLA